MTEVSNHQDEDALAQGWARVEWLVCRLLGMPVIRAGLELDWNWTVTGMFSASLRREVRGLLAAGEALARRLIGILALEMLSSMAVPPQRPVFAGTGGEKSAGASNPRTPAFALFEPVATLRSWTGETGPGRRRVPTIMAGPKPAVTAPRPPALIRRVAALAGVLKHRRRAAWRLARRLSRKGCRKRHNLRPGAPPGFVRTAREDGPRADDLGARLRAMALARAGPDGQPPQQDPPARHRGPHVVEVRLAPLSHWERGWG